MSTHVTLSIDIASANAAFQDDPHYELNAIMRTAVKRMQASNTEEQFGTTKLHDTNGNAVGTMTFILTDEE